ncbi:MAG: arsenic efflux protein [Eggerthellaceae bacterium]
MHIAGHVLEHSVADTLYIIPFLFVTYLAMEWLEHKTGGRAQAAIQRAGAAGPVVGAVVGAVPQCGFSAAAATLWAGRVITLGTLFAVFLSTSDEMLPIFLAEQVPFDVILKIIGAKIIIGMVMGSSWMPAFASRASTCRCIFTTYVSRSIAIATTAKAES